MNLLPRRMRRLKRLCEVLGRAKALAPQASRAQRFPRVWVRPVSALWRPDRVSNKVMVPTVPSAVQSLLASGQESNARCHRRLRLPASLPQKRMCPKRDDGEQHGGMSRQMEVRLQRHHRRSCRHQQPISQRLQCFRVVLEQKRPLTHRHWHIQWGRCHRLPDILLLQGLRQRRRCTALVSGDAERLKTSSHKACGHPRRAAQRPEDRLKGRAVPEHTNVMLAMRLRPTQAKVSRRPAPQSCQPPRNTVQVGHNGLLLQILLGPRPGLKA